jgi:hypothetical protein
MNSSHAPSEVAPPRRNRWFLASTVLLEIAWIAFLTILAIAR